MGAGTWASQTIDELQNEFEVSNARAVRVTNLVRQMVSSPDFDRLRDVGLVDENFTHVFVENTVNSLKKQEGSSIEERWNNLVKSFGLHDVAGEAVYLESWDNSTKSTTQKSEPHPTNSGSNEQYTFSSWGDNEK